MVINTHIHLPYFKLYKYDAVVIKTCGLLKFNLVVLSGNLLMKDKYFVFGSRNVTQIEREVAKIVLSCCQIHLNAIWHN